MIWLPIVICGGVVVLVYGLYFNMKLRGNDPGISFFMLTACLTYTVAITGGFFITKFASPTIDDWWQAVAVRVGLLAAGLLLICISSILTARENGRLGWKIFAMLGGFALVAFWCGYACIFDLLEGPTRLQVVGFEVQNVRGGARGGARIFASLKVRDASGKTSDLDMSGWTATMAQDALAPCENVEGASIIVLENLEEVLGAECHR